MVSCMSTLTAATLSPMARSEVPEGDWPLVASVIDAERAHRALTIEQLAKTAGNDRGQLSAMAKGRGVTVPTLRKWNGAVGLPRDFLLYVLTRDVDKIKNSGAEQDLIRWLTADILSTHKGSETA